MIVTCNIMDKKYMCQNIQKCAIMDKKSYLQKFDSLNVNKRHMQIGTVVHNPDSLTTDLCQYPT